MTSNKSSGDLVCGSPNHQSKSDSQLKSSIVSDCENCTQCKVLIVDDVSMNVRKLKFLLNFSFDVEADSVSSQAEALKSITHGFNKICCESRYSLVFTNHKLPNLNGYELSTQIREMVEQQRKKKYNIDKITVVLITETVDEKVVEEAKLSGMYNVCKVPAQLE